MTKTAANQNGQASPETIYPMGTVYLYHPSIPLSRVALPVPVFGFGGELDPSMGLTAIQAYLEAGFTPHDPSLGAGQEADDVGWIVLRMKRNKDNSTTPLVDFYASHERMKFRTVSHYLNAAEDIQAFEAATGLILRDLPILRQRAPIDKEDESFAEVAVRPPRVLKIVRKLNPDYVEGSKEEAKWLFVSYGVGSAPRQDDNEAKQPCVKASEIPEVIAEAQSLGIDRPLLGRILNIKTKWGDFHGDKAAALKLIHEYAQAASKKEEAIEDIPF